jgi:hypothetical protein
VSEQPPTNGDCAALERIVRDTTPEVFELAGGFAFTDEIALALNEKWRGAGPVVPVAVIDLVWLLDGYVRARQAATAARQASDG